MSAALRVWDARDLLHHALVLGVLEQTITATQTGKDLITCDCVDGGKITCPPGFSRTRQERWRRQPAYTQAAARCCPLAWSPRACHNLLMMTVLTPPGMMTATVLTPPGILNAFAVLCCDDGMSKLAFLAWHDPLENLESHSDVSTLDTDFFDVRFYCSSSWRQTAPGVLSVFLVEMSGTCCNRDPGDSWRNPSVVMRMIGWWWLSRALTINKISSWRLWEMWVTRSVIQNWSGREVSRVSWHHHHQTADSRAEQVERRALNESNMREWVWRTQL